MGSDDDVYIAWYVLCILFGSIFLSNISEIQMAIIHHVCMLSQQITAHQPEQWVALDVSKSSQ